MYISQEAGPVVDQPHLFAQTGLMNAPVVSLDLKFDELKYPTHERKGVIYAASVLVLSCSNGT